MIKKYESKQHEGVFIEADIETANPKTKTLFATTTEGKTLSLSLATLKRWWAEVNSEEIPQEVTIEEEPKVEEPVVEVVEPVVEAPKPKKAKATKKAESKSTIKYDTIGSLIRVLDKLGVTYQVNNKCNYVHFDKVQVYRRTRTNCVRFFVSKARFSALDCSLYTNPKEFRGNYGFYVSSENFEKVVKALI